jgi:hypothetical protein
MKRLGHYVRESRPVVEPQQIEVTAMRMIIIVKQKTPFSRTGKVPFRGMIQ